MWIIGLILLVALLIPIMGIIIDSPIGRALARRLEGPDQAPPAVSELARRIDVLEAEVEDLSRGLQAVQEENQFLQRLIEDAPQRTLPPPPAT